MKSQTAKAELHRIEGAELLLIRTGQHLFKEWRSTGQSNKDLEASFECIWQLKRELRARKDGFRTKSSGAASAGV